MVGDWAVPADSKVQGPPRDDPVLGYIINTLHAIVHPPPVRSTVHYSAPVQYMDTTAQYSPLALQSHHYSSNNVQKDTCGFSRRIASSEAHRTAAVPSARLCDGQTARWKDTCSSSAARLCALITTSVVLLYMYEYIECSC